MRATGAPGPMCLAGLVLVLAGLLGCGAERQSGRGDGPVGRYLQVLDSKVPVPASLPWHARPAVGQWALSACGDQLRRYRITGHGDGRWLVEEVTVFRGIPDRLVIEYRVDDRGRVAGAVARREDPTGRASRRVVVAIAPPTTREPSRLPSPPPAAGGRETIAGLAAWSVAIDERRYWLTDEPVFFARRLDGPDGTGAALVQIAGTGGTVFRLLAQGEGDAPDPVFAAAGVGG